MKTNDTTAVSASEKMISSHPQTPQAAETLSAEIVLLTLEELLRVQEAYAATSPMKNRGVSAVRVQALRQTIVALRAQPTFGEWLPIETAPKDGTPVLLLEPPELSGSVAYGGIGVSVWCYDTRYTAGGYWPDDSDGLYAPTHWMPLPSPPPTPETEQ